MTTGIPIVNDMPAQKGATPGVGVGSEEASKLRLAEVGRLGIDSLRARKRVRVLRWISWLVFGGEVTAIVIGISLLTHDPKLIWPLVKVFWPVILFWQILPLVASRLAFHRKQRVNAEGNNWRIGKYSEDQVRSIARDATVGLPTKLKHPRILIADHLGTGGWTWLSLVWPGSQRQKTIWITEGSLHYLETDELKALILHELGHHASENRCDAPGGWLFADYALFSLSLWLGTRIYLEAQGVFVIFIVARSVAAAAVRKVWAKSARIIEHLCDLYAARKATPEAMVNVLLKAGEEEELVEVVLMRAAKELQHVQSIDIEELRIAFDQVRPAGRIFHNNLFRHASEMVHKYTKSGKSRQSQSKKKVYVNSSLADFVSLREKVKQRRVKWRSFDQDGKGRLSKPEIDKLCEGLRRHPTLALFVSESERNPSTHPRYRDRILCLANVGSPIRVA